jgi:hypothetical protein
METKIDLAEAILLLRRRADRFEQRAHELEAAHVTKMATELRIRAVHLRDTADALDPQVPA